MSKTSEQFVDYYKVLHLKPNADKSQIRKSFLKLAKTHHPDAGGSTKEMQLINKAYETLHSSLERAAYDRAYELHYKPVEQIPVSRSTAQKTYQAAYYTRSAQPQPYQTAYRYNHKFTPMSLLLDVLSAIGWSTIATIGLLLLILFVINKLPLLHLNDISHATTTKTTTVNAPNATGNSYTPAGRQTTQQTQTTATPPTSDAAVQQPTDTGNSQPTTPAADSTGTPQADDVSPGTPQSTDPNLTRKCVVILQTDPVTGQDSKVNNSHIQKRLDCLRHPV